MNHFLIASFIHLLLLLLFFCMHLFFYFVSFFNCFFVHFIFHSMFRGTSEMQGPGASSGPNHHTHTHIKQDKGKTKTTIAYTVNYIVRKMTENMKIMLGLVVMLGLAVNCWSFPLHASCKATW